ncbi:hypothetical protein A2U01_0105548, partial [Trifolium medium]|nr:hypothetical protein [Trifolium medium]
MLRLRVENSAVEELIAARQEERSSSKVSLCGWGVSERTY